MNHEKAPSTYEQFCSEFPEIAKHFENLGESATAIGPMDGKTCRLIKLALSVGSRLEGAVHADTRKALKAGATKQELYQVTLLAITTIGFPASMAAMSWIRDITEPSK